MLYINNNNEKIYYDFEGQGSPLVLQHALASNLNAWKHYDYIDAIILLEHNCACIFEANLNSYDNSQLSRNELALT
jgi:hypothetical protein